MNEERLKILGMLSDGKINVKEAEALLEAMNTSSSKQSDGTFKTKKTNSSSPENLYICVEPNSSSTKEKVNIKVPFKLLKAGMKLASLLPSNVQGKINTALGDKGYEFDLSKINSENVEELLGSFGDFSVDVEGDKETVRIYCE